MLERKDRVKQLALCHICQIFITLLRSKFWKICTKNFHTFRYYFFLNISRIAEQIHALEVAEEECTEYKSMAAPDEPASPEAIPRRGSILVTPADIRRGSIVLNAPIRSVIRDRDVERNPVAAGSAKELIGRRRVQSGIFSLLFVSRL